MNFPLSKKLIQEKFNKLGIANLSKASIREIVRISMQLEAETGIKFLHMEMGVPGLPPPEVGVEAEIAALRNGIASKYPMIEGLHELKEEIAKFAKLFINIDISPQSCIPSVGSMQGSFAVFLVSCRREAEKDTTLFIDPGFPVQKQQHHVIGLKYRSFDIYDFRGDKLTSKLEEMMSDGKVSTIVYSSPNNPSWICLTEKELQIIAKFADKYGAIVVEDLAYFGMDFRVDVSRPGAEPYQPSVARYTDNYVLLVSSSKIFSYAGQRIGMLIISDTLYKKRFSDLKKHFSSDEFGHALVYGALYALSSGTAHSPQYALLALLKETNTGKFNFVEFVKEYEQRASEMKRIFTSNGFKIVYDMDEDKPLANGFYFTISYSGMNSGELILALMRYGISSISLEITGSERKEGLRACVSQIGKEHFAILEERLKKFNDEYKKKQK